MAELLRVDASGLTRRAAALAAQPRRLAAFLTLVVLVATTAWFAPNELRSLRNDIAVGRNLSDLERQAGGARHIRLDPQVLVAAERRMPPDATFAVVTGPGVDPPSPLAFDGIRQLAAYWLLPRRRSEDPRAADWVLSYGGDLGALGLGYRRVVELAPGIELAEVR